MSRVPIYIITGFLGSGKTTLLRHIISSLEDSKVAIIQNDFSDEMGIEAPTMQDKDGNIFKEFFELPNGCVCCTVKDELLKAVEYLLKSNKFEKILLETTGIADPEPIIEKFWVDCELETAVELSGVITVVDVLNFKSYIDLDLIGKSIPALGENHPSPGILNKLNPPSKLLSPEILKQILLANKVILNKMDLLSDSNSSISEIEAIIKVVNPVASVSLATKSQVKLDWLFDLDAYNISKVNFEIDNAFKNALSASSLRNNNHLTRNISSYTFSFESEKFDLKSIEKAIAKVAWEGFESSSDPTLSPNLIRYKGLFIATDPEASQQQELSLFALQGVGQIFEILPIKTTETFQNTSKFFFLGLNLDKAQLSNLLQSCIT
ncbi:COBW domain-containing protein 2 [Cryptosporidium felis]|nr:COBW domain-containing protein 2 [Cryptosporidium felis]